MTAPMNDQGVTCYVYVRNTAMNALVSMQKERFTDFEEARDHKRRLSAEYGQIGCHEVKMLVELWPSEEEEDDIEDEFSELEEEE